MNITGFTIEKLEDPTGILVGDRYEYIIDIEVPEDDELFSENGLYVKVIYVVNGNEQRIAQYQIFENITHTYLDFELEEEELQMLHVFCKENLE
ncbi:DUF6509 family protein [Heyndrickxia sporothermodurans]|uniref:Pullulanase n=1 Tax=Heyndrickxia sporothermodurans TaxID=46224 RepID=A0A150KNB1_9BACI|nr:DUF6509 family protein [Heyndrickxia sporothermodurans]KYC92258.1 hypothetical protein B4102_3742 [Heyndrickxia sporothermodurans]MBL5772581.1 pullulanase [Heyndrickxia sporothermodurans]MBL5776469.1 pullulanase [Heyndrickxia sporothermodurans]MBL5783190.1 pullulanase [Heyndrickxia sporothermodurans]MBL5793685.1 pullulanase [Heyndrickxia sporothermodurans]